MPQSTTLGLHPVIHVPNYMERDSYWWCVMLMYVRSSYGSRQPTLLNDWSTPALSEVPGHVPPTTSGHASTSSQLTRPAMWSIQSHSRADTRCVAARPPASQRSRTDTDTRHHLNSVSVVRTSPPLADRRADTRTPGNCCCSTALLVCVLVYSPVTCTRHLYEYCNY